MANGYFLKAAENTVKAFQRVQYCDDVYKLQTKDSVDKSLLLTPEEYGFNDEFDNTVEFYRANPLPVIQFIPEDTVSVLLEPCMGNIKYTVLNFASYKHPGGMFLKGSSAQEECLCHESNLYPILRDFDKSTSYYSTNRALLNRSMYTDIGIYTPDVIFERKGYFKKKADVVTMAAPNYTDGKKHGITLEANDAAMECRIKHLFLSLIYATEKFPNVIDRGLILGAWGCGVFGQDPFKVARLFRKYIELGYAGEFQRIIFAILPGYNYDGFFRGYTTRD